MKNLLLFAILITLDFASFTGEKLMAENTKVDNNTRLLPKEESPAASQQIDKATSLQDRFPQSLKVKYASFFQLWVSYTKSISSRKKMAVASMEASEESDPVLVPPVNRLCV